MSETMDYYRNLETNEETMDDLDIIDEKMAEAVQEIASKRQKLLALALHRGYDGVDILPTEERGYRGEMEKFRIGFQWEAWEDDPPHRDMFERFERYDFRNLNEEEEREILARIGVMEKQNE